MDGKASAIAGKIEKSESALTSILNQLGKTTELDEARVLAELFLQTCAMDKHTPSKLRQLSQMTSVTKIYSLCYNTMLSGEGLGVCK